MAEIGFGWDAIMTTSGQWWLKWEWSTSAATVLYKEDHMDMVGPCRVVWEVRGLKIQETHLDRADRSGGLALISC